MATHKIKGLTVEIGGDTTKLGEALKNVEAKSRSLSSELGSINRLLKLDPTNTDLLTQKQQVLAEAIGSTREKLETLKAAEKQVQEQFAHGEVSAEQYRELQREIAATENKLKQYEDAAKDTAETLNGLSKSTKTAEGRIKELANRAGLAEKDLDKLKDKAGEVSDKGLKVMAAAATAAVAALTAAAEATRDYRTNMGKLNVAFTDNGHSVEDASTAYRELVGVIGESDRSVETANHLAKLTDNAEDLSDWYGTILPGVFATFGDSLPLEGLTEAANETAKVSKITGPLADAINWATTESDAWAEALGDNTTALQAFRSATAKGESAEDAFNSALATCSTEQERQALITNSLTKLYGSAAKSYKTTNAEIIRANKANDAWTASLARTGAQMEPIITDVKEMGTELLRSAEKPVQRLTKYIRGTVLPALQRVCTYVLNNGPKLIGVASGLTTAMVAYKIGAAAAQIATSGLTKALLGAEKAQKLLNLAQAATPWGLALAGVAAVTTAIVAYCAATNTAAEDVDNLTAKERDLVDAGLDAAAALREQQAATLEAASGIVSQFEHTEQLAQELMALADASGNVQEADRARADVILGLLNDALGTEYTMVNGQIQAYGELKASVEALIETKRTEALMDAYKSDYTEALKAQKDAVNAAATAYKDYAIQQDVVTKKTEELTAAQEAARKHGDNASAQRVNQLWRDLEAEKQALEVKKTAWEDLSGVVDTYSGTIRQYEEALVAAQRGDSEEVQRILSQEAIAYADHADNVAKIKERVRIEMRQAVIDAGKNAEDLRRNWENGVDGYTEDMVKEAEDSVKKMMAAYSNVYGDAEGIGLDFGDGMIAGIKSKSGAVLGAVVGLVGSMFAEVRKVSQTHSPSRKMDKVFQDIWAGAEVGTDKAQQPLLDATAETVRKMMNVAADADAPAVALQSVERQSAIAASAQAAGTTAAYTDKLDRILSAIEAGQYIMLDGDALVGRTIARSNMAMAQLQTQAARNVR